MNLARKIAQLCFAALSMFAPVLSHGQAFPLKPIRLIVPTAPGGGTDVVGRSLAKVMQSQGIATFVENKGGAGGAIGLAAVANAAPDGYTVGFAYPDPVTITPQLVSPSELGYKADKDFLPIAQVGDTHYAFAVSTKLPVRSMSELIAFAKSKPRQLFFATQGRGSAGHLIMKLLEQRTGAEFVDVPYKGAGPAMAALMSGEAQVIATSPASLNAAVAGGRLKAIAAASETRSAMLPNMPTMAESGYPGFVVSAWWGVIAPAGVPNAVAAKLTEIVLAATRSPEMAERMASLGGEVRARDQGAFRDFIRSDAQLWKKVVTDGKITLQE